MVCNFHCHNVANNPMLCYIVQCKRPCSWMHYFTKTTCLVQYCSILEGAFSWCEEPCKTYLQYFKSFRHRFAILLNSGSVGARCTIMPVVDSRDLSFLVRTRQSLRSSSTISCGPRMYRPAALFMKVSSRFPRASKSRPRFRPGPGRFGAVTSDSIESVRGK